MSFVCLCFSLKVVNIISKIMSVLHSDKDCVLISHKEYIDRMYRTTAVNHGNLGSDSKTIFTLKEDVFDFSVSNGNDIDDKRRHRKINSKKSNLSISQNPELHELNHKLASKSTKFLDHCKRNNFFKSSPHHPTNNSSLSVFNEVSREKMVNDPLNGRNTLDNAILTNISGQTYLVPPHCKFTNSCVSEIDKFADEFYDFIVMDPPWWNKYIRRVRMIKPEEGYDLMYNDDILKIPLEDLIHPNTIVAIWCTNSPTHLEFIKKIALPKWNLKLLATHYWVKITNSGDPICEFNAPLKKQPYEQLFLATHIESERLRSDDINLMFSVPSIIHSHKPPLMEIFKDYLPAQPKCLEIFARYLLPHFSSIGREVLKLQNTILFEEKRQEVGSMTR